MTKHASERFDVEGFWEDVDKWRIRRNLSIFEMAHLIGMDGSTFRMGIKFRKSLSLRYAAELAALCDLDLNAYIKTGLCASL